MFIFIFTGLLFWFGPDSAKQITAGRAFILLFWILTLRSPTRFVLYTLRQRVRFARQRGEDFDERDVRYLFPPEGVRLGLIPGPEAPPNGTAVRTHMRAVVAEAIGFLGFFALSGIAVIPATQMPGGVSGRPFLFAAFMVVALCKAYARAQYRRVGPNPNDCQHCGYRAVRSLESRRCPECGMVVEDGAVVNEKARVG